MGGIQNETLIPSLSPLQTPQSPSWISALLQAPAPFPNFTSTGEMLDLDPDRALGFLPRPITSPAALLGQKPKP